MGTEALGGGCILNAVSIGEDHTLHLIGRLSLARAAASKRTKEAIELKEILFGFETDKGYSAFVRAVAVSSQLLHGERAKLRA
jgi:hypothetical protein